MTGRWPTSTGMFLNDLYLPERELCMAQILKQAGYTTGYIGKWHLDGHGRESYIPPERRKGWEYWKAAECDHNYNHSHYYAGTSDEKKYWDGYDAFARPRTREYIRQHAKQGQPFVLMVSYGPPHFPHATAPQAYKDLYPADKIRLPPNVPAAMRQRAKREAQGYYAHCTAVDKCVSDVLSTLSETGLEEKTIVVFTSDHGEMMGSHGDPPTMKQQPWDEAAHVPLLFRYPGRAGPPRPGCSDSIDYARHPADLAGPGRRDHSGPRSRAKTFRAVVRGGPEQPDRPLSTWAWRRLPAADSTRSIVPIRTAQYTYVRGLEGPWLLFDDKKDPYQLKNLVTVPEYAALRAAIGRCLQAALRKIGDPFRPAAYYIAQWGLQVAPGKRSLTLRVPAKRRNDNKLAMCLHDSFFLLLQSLVPIMTAPSFANFRVMVTGWIFAGRHTITQMLVAAGAVRRQALFGLSSPLCRRARWSLRSDGTGGVRHDPTCAWRNHLGRRR